MRRLLIATLAASLLTGCNMFLDPSELGPDGQQGDAAISDAGTSDAGTTDVGTTDTGSTIDAGPVDADTTDDAGGEEDMTTAENRLVVFDDQYAQGVRFVPFGGADNDLRVVPDEGVDGSAALSVAVPAQGYTGGTLVPAAPANVSEFSALRFSVRASKTAVLNVSGIGITGTDVALQAERNELVVTTEWTTFIIPLPDPTKLSAIPGLFHFAEGAEEGAYEIFFDDIEYVEFPENALTNSSAGFTAVVSPLVLGGTRQPPETTYSVSYAGGPITLTLAGGHLDWITTDQMVASVDAGGVVTGQSSGSVTIAGTLGGASVGQYDLTVVEAPSQPAPVPTKPSGDIIAAIFSDAYPTATVPVDTYNKPLASAEQDILDIAGNPTLVYTALDFAVIEMLGTNSLDLAMATTFSIDIWTVDGVEFRVKLVDFGADDMFDGGDDSEHEITFNLQTLPGFTSGQWYTIEIPLSDFVQINSFANISQIVLVGRSLDSTGMPVPRDSTFFVDNILFYR